MIMPSTVFLPHDGLKVGLIVGPKVVRVVDGCRVGLGENGFGIVVGGVGDLSVGEITN